MGKIRFNQVVSGATPGDAITDQALLLQKWLKQMGFQSDIYAEHIAPELSNVIYPITLYTPQPNKETLIYHHSIGSSFVDRLVHDKRDIILIYHNVTPPEFFLSVDPALAQQMQLGRQQLHLLQPYTKLALADSVFNEIELQQAGFKRTGVLPIVLNESNYNHPVNTKLMSQFDNSDPILLFVSRIVPNKKQEDLIKLLYYYKRIAPRARLILVGSKWLPAYAKWLDDFANDLGLSDSVIFAEHVSQQDLVTYYRMADVYVSMSEHEGFGKPLIESMYFDLPVLAYSVAAVPYTLGSAGVQFHYKHYEALAEVVDVIVRDAVFREQIISKQRITVQGFLEAQVYSKWVEFLEN